VGDAMIRELDQSRTTLRLVEHIEKEGKGAEDRSIAKLSGSTLQTLQRCLYTPTQLTLRDNEGRESKVTVSLKYLPIKMKLDPSESFNNMGKLRVDIMDAADLPAADRNGFSDPFCKFILNGKEVYKTDKQKKTLHPAWNETFETMIRSRTAAKLVVEVYDWDFGDSADFLGKADIALDILEPFQRKEVTLGLDGKSGSVRLRMLFTPEFVTRMRQGSSTFQGTFAAPGKIIGAPVKGVGKGAILVGSTLGGGVSKAGSLIGKPFRRRKSGKDQDLQPGDEEEVNGAAGRPGTSSGTHTPVISVDGPESVNGESPAAPRTPTATDSGHARTKSWGQQSRPESMIGMSPGGHGEQGTANISILSASGFPPSTNLRVIVKMDTSKGSKEVHKTKAHKGGSASFADSESFKVTCSADTPLKVAVVNDHTLRRDEELGEAMFVVSDQGSGGESQVKVGTGTVTVRSSFSPSDVASSLDSPKAAGGMLRSRFKRDRSVTPSGGPSAAA
jgi:C2 domain